VKGSRGQGLLLALAVTPLVVVSLRDQHAEDLRGATREAVAELTDLAAAVAVVAAHAPGGCPGIAPGAREARVGPTPPLDLDCHKDPSERCFPVDLPSAAPSRYWRGEWFAAPLWRDLGIALARPHVYHYALTTAVEPGSGDRCRFRAQARGDLDGDGVWSTIEVAGIVDGAGATIDRRWRLEDPLE
jgi:hypothetical protein